jgi:hypothetical protein
VGRIFVLCMARSLTGVLSAVELPATEIAAAERPLKPQLWVVVGVLELAVVERLQDILPLVAWNFPLFLPAVAS